ncbi:hypothetical protein DL98DRAFT_650338 [Cadophora sp. DSE1049]|nr:hypothetical protein DL98DRAFT_650338 [Cadophora sp. DSE1049]
MASNHAYKSIIIDVDCHDQQIPATETLSSPGKIGALNDLDSIVMFQLPSGHTPNSQSFRNASPASSARSSSPTPSIFDDDLSPTETPLTAPLPKQPHPSSSSRLGVENLQKISTLSFVDKDAKQRGGTSGANTSPTVQTSPVAPPQRSITPVLEDQIAEQHSLQTMDYFTSNLAQMKLDESPMSQKLRRRKHGQEVAEAVKAISTQLSFLNFDKNNTGPGDQGEGTDRAEDELYQESLALPNTASCVPNQHLIKLDGDRHEMSNVSLPEFDARRSKAAEDIPGSPTAEFLVVKEADRERRSQSSITLSLDPLISGSNPEISTRSSAPEQLGADITSKIDIPEELDKGFGSLVDSKPAPSSRSKTPAARKSRNSSSGLHENEVHRITRSTVPRTSGRKSLSVEEETLGSPDAAHSMDLASTKDINISIPRQKKAPKAKNVSKVISHVFEKYHDNEKSSNELKLEILGEVRQKAHEDKLLKSLATPLVALLPRPFQKYFFSYHALSSHETDPGFIYIFKSDECPGHVKIGKTKQKPEIRISQWSKGCKFTCIHVAHPDDKSFYHYGVVEKLVEAELWNMRRKFKCGECKYKASHEHNLGKRGPTEHGEWYEITETHALEIVQKWRKWIVEREPYLQTGVLRQHWKWKHDQAMKGGDVDWVKWRLSNRYEYVQYFWHCLHKAIADYFILARAFVLLLGAANLFLPSDGYCLRVGRTALAIAVLFITYRCIYW